MVKKATFINLVYLLILYPCLLIFFLSSTIFSQGISSGGVKRIEGKFKFMPIPYINYNRSIGLSLGALPLAMFNPVENDTISPSSITGLLGMYATNGTWFGMGFGALFLDNDNWRLVAAGGLGSIKFQFYLDNPIDSWVPYNTQAVFAFTQVKRRIYDTIYVGLSYIHTRFKTSTEVFSDTSETILNGIGLHLSVDRRLNLYYPRSGFYANIKYFKYPKAFGNKFVSNKIEIDYNHYFSFRKNQDVLAGRFYAGLGIGDLSFNQQFIIGQKDIRGYTQGEYRGNYLLAIQAEYRWNFHQKLGLVGFLGFATVFESINKEDDGIILPGIGTGFRYLVSSETHMNVGMDIAMGRNDWGIYFRIGETF